MATSVLWLDDDDLTASGWQVLRTSGLDDLLAPTVREVTLPGLERTVELSTFDSVAPRDGILTLWVRATTYAAMQTALQRLRYRVGGGPVTLKHIRRPNQRLQVRLVRGPASYGSGPEDVGPFYVEVPVAVRAANPFWEATTQSAISFTTSAVAMPLGDAKVRPTILIAASGGSVVNPTVTYKNAGGTTIWSLAITHTIASGDAWEFNALTGTVRKRVSGVWSNAANTLVAGYTRPYLSPRDGDFFAPTWPTLQLSASSGSANAQGTSTFRAQYA